MTEVDGHGLNSHEILTLGVLRDLSSNLHQHEFKEENHSDDIEKKN